jgi:N-acetylmuramoyl-L-alanine amidase
MTSIAFDHGFSDPAQLYNHAENAELRAARPNMHVLYEGDKVVIPERQIKEVAAATEHSHRFKAKLPMKKLVLVFRDAQDAAIEGMPYRLVIGKREFNGKTDSAGKIACNIHPLDMEGRLSLCDGPWLPILIGHLNPMKKLSEDDVSGVQARLHNLGYDPGAIDGVLGPRTRQALRRFQAANNLSITGKADGETLDKLEAAYGF